jgi:hypothetical protein
MPTFISLNGEWKKPEEIKKEPEVIKSVEIKKEEEPKRGRPKLTK